MTEKPTECGDVFVLRDNPGTPEPVSCGRTYGHKGWHRHTFQTYEAFWMVEWNNDGEHKWGKVW